MRTFFVTPINFSCEEYLLIFINGFLVLHILIEIGEMLVLFSFTWSVNVLWTVTKRSECLDSPSFMSSDVKSAAE